MTADDAVETPTQRRKRLVRDAEGCARDQHGVLSRRQLRAIGVTRHVVRTEVRGKRWRAHGLQTVAVHTGSLDDRAAMWSALFEVGADAALDGVSSLIAGGLTGYQESVIYVSTSHGTNPRDPPGVSVQETRRRRPGDVVPAGIPRTRPAVAAIRGALWAKSDRQAALIIVMAVQQRLTTGQRLLEEFADVHRHRRRAFLGSILVDVTDGAQALGELDFAAWCRRYGLPQPSRQVLRKGRNGRMYLDVYWDSSGVVVEVEGIHHGAGETQVNDALRQNTLSLRRDTVLRVPLLGLRIAPDAFMAQVAESLDVRRAA